MKFVVEPYSGGFDPLTVGGNGDLVLATFWNGVPWGMGDIPTIASTTHTWGIPITDAEAFTGSPFERNGIKILIPSSGLVTRHFVWASTVSFCTAFRINRGLMFGPA